MLKEIRCTVLENTALTDAVCRLRLGGDLRAQGRTIERLGRDNIRAILDDAERGADVCPDGMR